MKTAKLYLVTFEYEGSKFFKVGITTKGDVMERFKYSILKYNFKNFKIHKSSWFKSEEEAKLAEDKCFNEIKSNFPENNYVDAQGNHHFHNKWLDEKINGITEIRVYNVAEYQFAWNYIDTNGVNKFKDLVVS